MFDLKIKIHIKKIKNKLISGTHFERSMYMEH